MSDEQTPDPIEPKAKPSKPPKPPKKVKRGTVIHEPERSVRKINVFRDRLIVFSGNVNVFLALALLISAASNAWIITQPNLPSPFFIQYTTGQIAGITLYSKERLPPPQPLDILPLAPQARLDDAPVYSSSYIETDTRLGVPGSGNAISAEPSTAVRAPAGQ